MQFLPPQIVVGIPAWSKQADAHTAFNIAVPSVDAMLSEQSVCAVTVWGRQWPAVLCHRVTELYWQYVRAQPSVEFATAALRDEVLALCEDIRPWMSPPLAAYHELVSGALMLAASVEAHQTVAIGFSRKSVAAALTRCVLQRNFTCADHGAARDVIDAVPMAREAQCMFLMRLGEDASATSEAEAAADN